MKLWRQKSNFCLNFLYHISFLLLLLIYFSTLPPSYESFLYYTYYMSFSLLLQTARDGFDFFVSWQTSGLLLNSGTFLLFLIHSLFPHWIWMKFLIIKFTPKYKDKRIKSDFPINVKVFLTRKYWVAFIAHVNFWTFVFW